ncbi:uncharacterized protein LOC143244541 isoform X2 [Tachypleus tridentatus]|uniref:uncharacterized protein LOC143244541 isoform X2 n=1 Tax=Tachypleus tridentatus TaxID=6853 RepID=UPI003FD66C6D
MNGEFLQTATSAEFLGLTYDSKLTWIKHVENELCDICQDILDVLDKHLVPKTISGESSVLLQNNLKTT